MEATALKIGEKIEYSVFVKKAVETKYGMGDLITFIKDGKVVRKTFAGAGLLDFLSSNPKAGSVELVDKVQDGEYTINIYQ